MLERPIVFSKIFLMIIVLLPISLVAQNLPLRHFQHTVWTLQDGAPSQIDALAQTTDGYIWLGTVNGLFRFDGIRFGPYKPSGGQQLAHPGVRSLMATDDGGLWIGYSMGETSFLKDGVLQTQRLSRHAHGGGTVFSIVADPDGSVRSATYEGLMHFLKSWSFKVILGLLIGAALWGLYLLRLKQETSKVRERLYERFSERERIARDLHDTFFQGIQGLLLSVQSASRKLPEGDESKVDLEKTLLQSDSVMSQGRELVFNLRARSRDANDLGSQLEASANQFGQHFRSEFSLIVMGEPKVLQAEVCEELCRLGREALCNAYRHAQASHIEVRIDYRPDTLRLAISDDGAGIDSAILAEGGVENHWGLLGMRERASRIGATFRIVSSPASGTIIQVDVSSQLAYVDSGAGALRRVMKLFGVHARRRTRS